MACRCLGRVQAEVSVKQRDTEADLAKAEPAVIKAMAALETLSKPDLGRYEAYSSGGWRES
jgi:dynein heavy chain, axonemal